MYRIFSTAGASGPRAFALTSFALVLALLLVSCTANGNPADPQPGAAEPYVAKGRVTDSRGDPMPGVPVFADNTAYYNMNVYGVSDADGHYRIELGDITPSSWRVGAYVDLEYNGLDVSLPLHPDNDQPFAGVTGAVRNLSWLMTGETPEGGHYGGLVYVYEDLSGEAFIEDTDLVELTFEPLAPLLDGTQGETTVRMLDGIQVDDLAITEYGVSARYLAPAGEPIDLLIRVRDTGEFGSDVVADFEDDGYGSLLMELQVRLP